MMSHFFDATRFGGLSLIRVNADAIAYLAEAENGTSIRLIGGETLRVNEDRDEVERRARLPVLVDAGPLLPGHRELMEDPAMKMRLKHHNQRNSRKVA